MKKWLVRILIGVVVLSVIGAIGTYFFIKDAVDTTYGGKVALADPSLSDATPARYVLANAAVLSADGSEFLQGQALLIDGGTIARIGAAAELPSSLPVIDGSGLFVVPGYTDSHVHLWNSQNDLLLYLAYGVTQVREMHGQPHHLKWKQEIAEGRLGPDLYVTAAQLATYGFWEGLWIDMTAKRNVVRSAQATDDRIHALHNAGYDAIKASSYLSREHYLAASDSMPAVDIPLVGHLPVASNLADLWSSQQTELAHVEELVKALDREFGGFKSSDREAFLAHVRARRGDIAQNVVAQNMAVTSTLAVVDSFRHQAVDLDTALAESRLEYINSGVLEGQAFGWLEHVNPYRAPDHARKQGWQDRYFGYWSTYADAQYLIMESLLDAGATILAGTDANVPVMVPGLSMHQEMQALNEAGMTPAEVLASATSSPSQWMGWNSGSIQEGYRANLVLLRENPLTDITATASIESVVVNGRLLSRSDLDAILQTVREANDQSRTASIDAYLNGDGDDT